MWYSSSRMRYSVSRMINDSDRRQRKKSTRHSNTEPVFDPHDSWTLWTDHRGVVGASGYDVPAWVSRWRGLRRRGGRSFGAMAGASTHGHVRLPVEHQRGADIVEHACPQLQDCRARPRPRGCRHP